MVGLRENRLKIRIGTDFIIGKNSAESYRNAFDLLFKKGLISDSILIDCPKIVKNNQNQFSESHRTQAVKIKNSNNLWIHTYTSSDFKLKQLKEIFNFYSIDGEVEIINDNLIDKKNETPLNIKSTMEKYFTISIDSLISTFSRIESGKEINFIVKTEQALPNDISINDIIIASVDDKVYYNFIVKEINGDIIKLYKTFEIAKSIKLNLETIGVFELIDKEEYDSICSKLFSDFKSSSSDDIIDVDFSNLKEKFADWLILNNQIKKNYFSTAFGSNKTRLIENLSKYEDVYKEEFNTTIFISSQNKLNELISELENNLYLDSGKFFSFSEKQSTHMPRAILGKNNYLRFLKELLIEDKKAHSKSPKVNPVNKIYFGAPGTGKSYQITQDLKDVDLIFQKRVTFHPEYDNTSFVGGYKPITDINGDIKYEFVPQIFTNIYVEACNDSKHQYYLIIEEINRGNCAEIFGELFQLLDRNKDYKITPSNELINYLNNNISNSEFYKEGKMLLPDNLSVLATMNTSDQSLFPMDSAFKRRWEWEYIPINYSTDSTINKSALFNIRLDVSNTVKWIDFIDKVNFKIKDNPSLGMDKCIGNYFVKATASNEISIETFIHKVIFYLWNDVFKDEPKNSIFKGKITYQDFFPIKDKGEKLVKSIFYDLNIIEPTELIEETNTEA